VPVRARFLVGVGAWLLGVAAATSGSMIAVNQLAHGLLGSQTQQLTGANLSINPDDATDQPVPSATASGPTDPPSMRSAAAGKRSHVKSARSGAATPSRGPSLNGTALQTPDGSVTAVCEAAGAYLQYWSPDPGFEADDVNRGPAAVTSVIFRGSTGSVGVRVTCVGGSPVAHLFRPPPDNWNGRHDT
jgi:hypothetical protein